jgi:acylphosphatase
MKVFFPLVMVAIGCDQPMPASGPAPKVAVKKRLRVHVSGKVQGVGFRAFVLREATELGLTGYVLNLPDGRVEAIIEGPDHQAEALLERVKQGPPGARVDSVDVKEQLYRGDFDRFRVDD